MADTQPTEPVAVTQEAREAAADLFEELVGSKTASAVKMRKGAADDYPEVLAFARFQARLASRPDTNTVANLAALQAAWDASDGLPPIEFTQEEADSLAAALRSQAAPVSGLTASEEAELVERINGNPYLQPDPVSGDGVDFYAGKYADKCGETLRLTAQLDHTKALLKEALDLVPRVIDDDPMVPALVDWCRRARSVLTRGEGG